MLLSSGICSTRKEPLPRPDDALNLHPAADGFTWSTQVSPSVTVTVNSFFAGSCSSKTRLDGDKAN
jgi:hypothetical protein